jgi:TonB family protein
MIAEIRANWVWVGAISDDHEVTVRFGVQPDGTVRGVRLVSSSGDLRFDQSVENAVRSLRALGPPPDQYRRDFSDVEIVFRSRDLAR